MMAGTGSRVARMALCAALLGALAVPVAASAQTPAPDPQLQAAKAAFEALPEADRRAIQEALVWTGDYNGAVDGGFGRRTFEAILSFETRARLSPDGLLDAKERGALDAAAKKARQDLNFTRITEERSGLSIGVPQRVLDKRTPTKTGTRFSSADGAVTLEAGAWGDGASDLAALFETLKTESPTRRVTYKALRPDWLVVTGEDRGRRFYTRIARAPEGAGAGLRGFTFSYPPERAPALDRIVIAVANSFEPFPARPAGPAAPGKATAAAGTAATPAAPPRPAAEAPPLAATGLSVGGGRVLTSAVVETCPAPLVAGQKARLLRSDKDSGLALLDAGSAPAGPPPRLRSAAPAAGEAAVVVAHSPAVRGASVSPAAIAAGGGRTPGLAAPLQAGAAGAPVFDRSGALVGIVLPPPSPPRLVAGVAVETRYPMADAAAIARLLGDPPLAAAPASSAAPLSAGAIAAEAGRSVVAVSCGR
ncbi:peptidoglycan-binding protein [Chelatococcus sp. SYSU_G07232]|uniref:Peptidoglycan-binding protein n=1 Tax=Chelatococcus albus TaxID=3047466 RepID=A0ABT7AJD7_9HYPH|nr:peptidoglycan-binding protein [Chelatococcus sp. SYSU_G07232]MDJ1159097.1 peptidoglycan-binding protein [Chelatococcus sp. SYSU_G07232]